MLRVTIILSTLAFGFAAVIPNGLLPQLDGRIIGGTWTTISSFPWQISLQRSGSHICGGSIYSHNIIVTAAHCVQNADAKYLKVRAGSTFSIFGGVLINVAAYKIHDRYKSLTVENDVAVLRLSSSLEFGSTISSISLTQSPPLNGAEAVVSGWGVTSSGATNLPMNLQKVNVEIVRKDVCASALYGYGENVKSSMICSFATGKDSCQADSGGPLVSDGLLVGIVSWGYGCALPDYPGVYTCVASVRSWIEDVARKI